MQFIAAAVSGGALLAIGGAGLTWVRAGNGGRTLSVEAALQKIDALAKTEVVSTGKWIPHQIFAHCAQTIEYSMSGYPASTPKLFQDTAGAAAFALFSSKGWMMHPLDEPIDGAPQLDPNATTDVGLTRLRQAFINFRYFRGELAPHFAYGLLSRQEYELAHVMHFWNHLDEIKA